MIIEEKTRVFVSKPPASIIVIETPQNNEVEKESIVIDGFVLSKEDDFSIELTVDDVHYDELINRYEKGNISASYYENYGQSSNGLDGFKVEMPTNGFKDGPHTIKVQLRSSKSGDIMTSQMRMFYIKKYDGIMVLDYPNLPLANSDIFIRGWELSDVDNSIIKIYLDNTLLDINVVRTERPDVLRVYAGQYGGEVMNEYPGFSTTLPLSHISDGSHKLTLRLFSKFDEELASISKEILVYRNVYNGIDVSSHNTVVNWSAVRQSGVEYAFIRSAVRGYGTLGNLREDEDFKSNVQNATGANIKVGTYVYSQAINSTEARQEAELALRLVGDVGGKDKVKLPIVFDTEFSDCWDNNQRCGRADFLSAQVRTNIAKEFLNTVRAAGYTPMIYASTSFLNNQLIMSQLDCQVWVAHWNVDKPTYNKPYQVWQYGGGNVNGISGNVDLDYVYTKY